MKVLAYARRRKGSPVRDQIARGEAHVQRQKHELVRLLGHDLVLGATEFPPRAAVLEACASKAVQGVVVTDLASLGPDLIRVLEQLEAARVSVLVAGDDRRPPLAIPPEALPLVMHVARAAVAAARPRRVCAPRVLVDVDEIRMRQSRGERLEDLAREYHVSRSLLGRRLRAAREHIENHLGD